MHERWRGFLWSITSAFSFSLEGMFATAAFTLGLSTPALLTGRYALAACMMALLLLILGIPTRTIIPPPGYRLLILITGMLGYGGTSLLLFLSFHRIDTGMAILLLYTYPAMVAVASHVLGDRRLDGRLMLALLLIFIGLATVTGASWQGAGWVGVALALTAALTNSGQVVVTSRLLQRFEPLPLTQSYLISGTLGMLLIMIFGLPEALAYGTDLAKGSMLSEVSLMLSPSALPILFGISLFPSFLAFIGLTFGIQLLGPSEAALLSTLEPVFAMTWGILWLGESWSGIQLLGAFIVMIGVLWVQLAPQTPHTHAT